MKIAIASDVHDNFENLKKAIQIANKNKCQYFLFAGDFVTPTGLELFKEFKGFVEMVWGNNEGDQIGFVEKIAQIPNVKMHGVLYEETLDGLRTFMNHYPRFAEIAAESQQYDLCIYGHTHLYREDIVKKSILLNSGNLKGEREEAGFVIFDTKDKSTERIQLTINNG